MLYFYKSLKAWNTDTFKSVFINEVNSLPVDALLLQSALQMGSYATRDNFQIMINALTENDTHLIITSGIFYSSLIAGCNCSDDPTPVDLNAEYCELQFTINKSNAETDITVIS